MTISNIQATIMIRCLRARSPHDRSSAHDPTGLNSLDEEGLPFLVAFAFWVTTRQLLCLAKKSCSRPREDGTRTLRGIAQELWLSYSRERISGRGGAEAALKRRLTQLQPAQIDRILPLLSIG
jgi:hypothetical protein